jgi:hypothetical protein
MSSGLDEIMLEPPGRQDGYQLTSCKSERCEKSVDYFGAFRKSHRMTLQQYEFDEEFGPCEKAKKPEFIRIAGFWFLL